MFHFVYVLRSLRDGRLYIGYSRNVDRRFEAHQEGQNPSTARRRPFELIYYEAFRHEEDAKRRERYFKTDKGKTTLKQMLREYLRSS